MSNRSMLEINHDYTPHTPEAKTRFLMGILNYLSSGDTDALPPGVTWFGMRHHSERCPLGEPPLGWRNEQKEQQK